MQSRVAGPRSSLVLLLAIVSAVVAGCGAASSTSAPAVPASAIEATAAPTSAGQATAAPEATGSAGVPSPNEPAASAGPSLPPITDLGDRLRATIDGVTSPCALATTATDVWVTGNGPSVLARIDPATNTIETQASMAGSACGIALGPDGRLWVALLQVGRVVAVDPDTAEVTGSIDGLGTQLWDLKSGFGAIWVVDRSKRELLRVDPSTTDIETRIPIGRSGSGLAITTDAVWVVDDVEGTILRIDPTTNAVIATSELERGSSWFANDDQALLVANRLDGSITPIESSDGAPGTAITGGTSPLDGTIAGGRAYIPDGKAGTLIEIDLSARTISTIDRLDGARNPFVAEVAFGDVWILDYGGKRIWRVAP